MSDFEDRVRHALPAGAQGAPPAVGLADAARGRRKQRRRTIGVVVATAAVLAAVPLGVAVVGGDDAGPDAGRDAVVADQLPSIPDGWRWESWRDIQVAVPGAWQEGAASQYCISSKPEVGVLDRGDGFSTQVACDHAVGPGVVFREGLAEQPLDAAGVSRRLTIGGNTVEVVAGDRETVEKIVASAHQFEVADSRGCAASFDEERVMSPDGEYAELPEAGVLSICDYDGRVGDGGTAYTLNSSLTLSEETSARLLTAIAEAAPGGSGRCSAGPEGEASAPRAMAYEVRGDGGRVAATMATSCGKAPLRTADGEFDGTELMTRFGSGEGRAGGPEARPVP